MIARIKFQRGRPVQRKKGKNRHVALALSALLIPASLMAYVLGFWRLASDLGIAGEFGITGLFSHWQIWIAMAVLLQVAASVLKRYGRGGGVPVRQVLMSHLFPSRRVDGADAAEAERKVGTR